MNQCPCGIARADCTYHKPVAVAPIQPVTRGGRGSGRTTRQLLALPKGGWYFCASWPHTLNIKDLANKVGRPDIVMRDVNELRDYNQFHGMQIPGFDIDHYVIESCQDPEIIDGADKLRSCVKPWAKP